MSKKTLVIGASENTSRYSAIAIDMLKECQHAIFAIGSRNGEVHQVPFSNELTYFDDVDTVTLYVNPTHQEKYKGRFLYHLLESSLLPRY